MKLNSLKKNKYLIKNFKNKETKVNFESNANIYVVIQRNHIPRVFHVGLFKEIIQINLKAKKTSSKKKKKKAKIN